ncbi:glyoxalase/bleomycin resistance protein/dioxygenase superfamily protein [Aliiruegeria haliotis]|uniref:Glyoxalase/bleomycin resistance protein/dioxygenase superfamily protein n=1 Tax=Aliiruegeria haliotis TaxID=1280846 RepID=A0A2T0RQU3_9RHOB|nr:VOC family protein [Aliiruegeria haliotis]PRY23564.1 glyoxalase/bleomycin resistance protein/dioxygenase superfamily protein [Aliiruegeria haliotis]
MGTATLEHANITVSDPKATAAELIDLFDWHIRWEGEAISGGYTVHVGNDTTYLAVYAPPGDKHRPEGSSYATLGGLNHIGVVVENIETAEARVKAAGYTPHNHADYEPGRRFYFDTSDGIEIEVVSYS